VVGTGAAINVQVGFLPRYIKVYNFTSATFETCEWWEGMSAGYGLLGKNSVFSQITTGGLSQYAGGENYAKGFTIGTNADLNAAGEVIYWLAVR
jgi:hypothetical protein